MLRTNIFLEEKQHQQIQELAQKNNQTFSGMLRDILNEGILAHKRKLLENAVKLMVLEYATDEELTPFTALDGEDFLE